MHEREHLPVNHPSPRRHPLDVPPAVSPRVAHGIGVIYHTLDGRGHGLESAMGVGRESWHPVAVVHSVGCARVEVGAVAVGGGFHPPPALVGGIIVHVVDAEEEWIGGGKWSRNGEGGGAKYGA